MQLIYFFYGLSFIVLSTVVFLMPKRSDCLNFGDDIIYAGLFGLFHGLNEWVELLIFRGEPFDTDILVNIWKVLLPLSFVFLTIFGSNIVSRVSPRFKWLKASWIFFTVLWAALSFLLRHSASSDIIARYILCFPGSILAAAAIYLLLNTCDYRQTPKSMLAGARIAIIAFLLYAVFSGLIAQKAGFFPASIINYDNFMRIFHVPVQLLRMACALLSAAGFVMITGTFYRAKGEERSRGSIKRKLTLIITVCVAIVTFTGIGLASFAGSNLLIRTMGREFVQVADSLSLYTKKALTDEVEDALSYTTRPLWKDFIIDKNTPYSSMDKQAIEKRMSQMDKVWTFSKSDDPVIRDYLDNRISVGMREIIGVRTTIAELFITDKYGGIIAASGKTSDFYQADEEWWKRAYNEGKGAIYVGEIEFDESSGKWVMAIAVPFRDETGEVIGICKDAVLIERLFDGLTGFKIGDTGHAMLIDEKGGIIFHHGITNMIDRVYTGAQIKGFMEKKERYFTAKDDRLHHEKIFAAYAAIKPPYFSRSEGRWLLFIMQDEAEALRPLSKFVEQLIIIALFMMILMMPAAVVFGSSIVNPIYELHSAMEHVMAGDWNYSIRMKTGDEIEQFADTFRIMIAEIRNKQRSLEEFSKGLEVKVSERTEDLRASREVAINILEDLQVAKEDLERTNRELMKLDQLKSDFISTVSHELRTPLSIIKEGISLVIDRIPGDINEKQQKILDIAKFNIDRLARIIDSLLDISKIEAGQADLKRSLINITDVVNQVASSFDGKIKEKGLELKLDVGNVSGSVWADQDRLIQVLTNLIGNAVKFTSSGYIKVSCKDDGEDAACSVTDTGVGISREDLKHVFNKFQQFGRLAGAGEKGTGLGLSIAKNIVDLHNGVISVESELGKGSSFTFKLRKYTHESLFREFTDKAIDKAARDGKSVSLILIAAAVSAQGDKEKMKARDKVLDMVKMIKALLRHEGDDVVSNDGEILIILAECDKENIPKALIRFKDAGHKYLTDKKLKDTIGIKCACAVYPDDAKSGIELVKKARGELAKA